jgi:DNA-binding transcriptional LysR family regulator
MITLNQLNIFLAVARNEHVTKAAEDINLSQSAVSMALSELEKQLNGPLFERAGRNLRLNDRGRLLQQEANKLKNHFEDMLSLFSDENDLLSGELKIGASSTIGIYLLPEIIGRFAQEYPDVVISLEIGNTDYVEKRLLDYSLDLGFVEGPIHYENIVSQTWLQDQLTIIASPDYFKSKKRKLTIGELNKMKWIMREHGSGTREVFEKALQPFVERINTFLTFGHTEAVKQAVKARLGVGCLSLYTVSQELERGTLIELKVPEVNLERQLHVITRKNSFQSRLRKRFSDFVFDIGNKWP